MIPKFRAWHTPFKGKKFGQEMKYGRVGTLLSFAEMSPDDYILMQSTGLKDKNGVEIFEGDIIVGQQHLTTDLSTPFEIKGVVRYSKRNTMFYLDDKSFGHDKFMNSLGSSIYQFEVIGNIYEDKELLEVAE
ncbi:YopX protein [Enterococcus malodoratus]|uniref:YopX family protein n=1 Tax=Enterococcus malodoratus TaxID=71451 RepID=UPI000D9600D9|nr:YopX family protein [Enterococcus malodoratus]SPW86801.1 YopX protein [Enterococcus malodoratus]